MTCSRASGLKYCELMGACTPAQEFPLSGPGAVFFYLLTTSGVHLARCTEAKLAAREDPFSNLFPACHVVLAEAREATERQESSEQGRSYVRHEPSPVSTCCRRGCGRRSAQRDLIRAGGGSVDLMLSGHTHGGQVQIFGCAPRVPRGSGRYREGWYEDAGPVMYVSRGVGTSVLPVRLGARPEVSFFESTDRAGSGRLPVTSP
jgi:hypothetical protein